MRASTPNRRPDGANPARVAESGLSGWGREGALHGRFGERSHHGVAAGVRVQVVLAEPFAEQAVIVNHRGVVVEKDVMMRGGIRANPRIQLRNTLGRPAGRHRWGRRTSMVVAYGREAAQHDAYTI